MKYLFFLFLFGSVWAADDLQFFDRAVYVQEGQRSGRTFTGFFVKKSENIYLVVCKHAIDPKINRWFISLPNQSDKPLALYSEWISHSNADLSIAVNPKIERAEDYAIDYSKLSTSVPVKLTPVVISGYPNSLVTKPIVSPVVRKTSVSSIETLSKNEAGAVIPVYFLNQFSGPGASGSPVFDFSNSKSKQPNCVGILSGGWNNRDNTGSVVTSSYYLRELIDQVGEKKE